MILSPPKLVCPLQGDTFCDDECGWYDADYDGCVLHSIRWKLTDIADTLMDNRADVLRKEKQEREREAEKKESTRRYYREAWSREAKPID